MSGGFLTGQSHILPEHDVRPYSVPQLAERWGCSDSMIRKLINQGELKCFRIGALIRVPAVEVQRFESMTAMVDQPPRRSAQSSTTTTSRNIGRKPRKRPPIVR